MTFPKTVSQPKVTPHAHPIAPPVYRPQPGALQSKRPATAPQVYRPSREIRPNTAPPVYRPQDRPAQLKPVHFVAARPPQPLRTAMPAAPPVYRPQPPVTTARPIHSRPIQPHIGPLAQQARSPQMAAAKPVAPRSAHWNRAIQPLILTILKAGEKNGGVLDVEIPPLEQGYNDHNVTLNDTTIPQHQSSRNLRAGSSNEVLVLNAHGSNNTVAGRSAQQMADLLTSVGATGYKEIHIYACQAGMSLYNFDQELSTRLDTPVWAPRGNITFNTGQGRYQVRRMTYDAESGRWVRDGDKEYDAEEAWWYSVRGRTIGKGTPPKPGAFPVEAPVDLSAWDIQVVNET